MSRELDGKLVLVVEDDSATLDGIAALLDSHGAFVEKVTTVEEALHVLRQAISSGERPDAVVSDLVLSGVSGIQLPDEIRKLDPSWRAPLVAISAYPDVAERARQAGFDDFVPKLVTSLLPLAIAQLFRARR